MADYSDFLNLTSGGGIVPNTGVWVRVVNNATLTAYVSTAATTLGGKFTLSPKPPPDVYTVYTGPTSGGAWTSTGDTNYVIPYAAGDNLAVQSVTSSTIGPNVPSALAKAGGQVWGTALVQGPPPSGGDDTGMLASLTATPNVHLRLQPGTYLVSAPIIPASGVIVQGASRKQTVIKAPAGVFGTPGTSRGFFDLTAATDIYSGNAFLDLGFDLTALTYGSDNIIGIHQVGSSVQHFLAENLWFELAANSLSVGCQLEGLGQGITHTSFDITFQNIYAHNGAGVVLLNFNANSATAVAHSIFIQNVVSLIDSNGVGDDRILVAGNQPSGGGNPEVRDVTIRGIYTTITAAVTSGTVNGVKVDSGSSGAAYVHNISIRDIFFRNYGSGIAGGAPVNMFVGSSSFLQDIFVDNIFGVNSGAIALRFKRFENDPSMTITNVHLKGCTSNYALEVYCSSAPTGDESVVLRNVSLHTAVAKSGNTPTGILLTGGVGQGPSGNVLIDAVQLENFSIGVTNNLGEALTTVATGWTNIGLSHIDFSNVTTPTLMISGTDNGFVSAGANNLFGAGAGAGGSGTNFLNIGTLGDAANVWLDAEGSTANIGMQMRTQGTGAFRFRVGNVALDKIINSYNGIATQGTGVPAIYQAPAPSLAQTAAVASIATVTSPNDGLKHVYRVSGSVCITTLGSGSINLQVAYTDSSGAARTKNIPLVPNTGVAAAAATTADDWSGVTEITVNPNTAITLKTAGTFTGCTYNTSGQIEQVL